MLTLMLNVPGGIVRGPSGCCRGTMLSTDAKGARSVVDSREEVIAPYVYEFNLFII